MSKSRSKPLSVAISEAVARHPDKPALVCPIVGDVTFAAFDQASSDLAVELQRRGIGVGHRVVLYGRRSASTLVAMRAVLIVGAAYVPVAHSFPQERVSYIIEDSQPSLVICDGATAESARALVAGSGVELFVFDLADDTTPATGTEDFDSVELSSSAAETDPLYLLYTSGSTGHPKGVIVSRANVADYVDWGTSYFSVTDEDRILSTAPFYFDMSVFDIYVALTTGATLVMASETDCLFPKLLVKKIEDNEVTLWKAVAALFAHVAEVTKLDPARLGSLETLIFSGERLPTRHLITWMNALPDASYFNAYGPTEATGISTCHRVSAVPDIDDAIPIGRPCRNTEILLFDGERLVEGRNETGEVVIAGGGIASGYWGDDVRSAVKFVDSIGSHSFPNPVYRSGDLGFWNDDGDLVFVARVDRQIKHQGYRIELDDIEAAMRSADGVSHAATLHIDDGAQPEIVGFVEGPDTVDETAVRTFVSDRLPKYMVPRRIIRLDHLPRTDRGKIDFDALRQELAQ